MFATAVTVATSVLVLVGYIAIREWRQGTTLLLEHRQAEMLMIATAALNRDMRGAWTTVLAPMRATLVEEDPPFRMMRVAAIAFARFPYPESFIVSKTTEAGESTYVLSRSDRMPPWEAEVVDEPSPVAIHRNPRALASVLAAAREDGSSGSFVSFATSIGGFPYLVVGHLLASASSSNKSSTLVAFTVNVDWVRTHYFRPLLEQVSRIGQIAPAMTLMVLDQQGRRLGSSGTMTPSGTPVQRTFPLLFIDPAALSLSAAQRLNVEDWTLQVYTSPVEASSAQAATFRLLVLMALAGVASAFALVMTVRAVRASAQLASMKSDFVAAVTHELKTPVALIRLVGDTLANRRYSSPGTVDEYARLLSREASRLSRTIDNLLTYSRYTDLTQESRGLSGHVPVTDLIEDAIEPFRPLLAERDITLSLDMAEGLPAIVGDRQALVQVFETLFDNAIKYSHAHSELRIASSVRGNSVHIEISDKGIGISDMDLNHVFERFHRGANATQPGSGLGLTIAQRIVASHRGSITLRSALNVGTTVEVSLPIGATS